MNPKPWLSRHAQTLIGSLGRLAQQPLASTMTIAVIAVALALPLILGVLLENARVATAQWNTAFDLSVYLGRQVPAGRVESLVMQLKSRPDVAGVRVIGADEALAEFRRSSGFGDALDALTDNPLPTTLIVTPALAASTPEGTAALRQAISQSTDVDTVQLDTDWVNRLNAWLDSLRRLVWIIACLLGSGVTLVVANTIRLDVLNRRTEIEVMKLVGASDGFARRPFLYTGAWYGVGGGLVALIIVTLGLEALVGPLGRLAQSYGSDIRLTGIGSREGLALLAGSAALGWIGSWIAATRHIRAIEPG